MSSDQRTTVEEEVVREFGEGLDAGLIAQRHNMTPNNVYEIVNRTVGPVSPPVQAGVNSAGWGHGTPMMPTAVAIVRVPPTSPFAVASLVFGIIGMLGGFCLMAIPRVIAVVCGHIG